MKGALKWVIIGLIILVVGVAVAAIGIAVGGLNAKIDYEMQTFTGSSATDVKINLKAGTLNAQFYEGEEIVVEYPVADKAGYAVTEVNGRLEIHPVERNWFWGWFAWKDIPDVTLKIPAGAVLGMDVHISAGTVNMPSGTFGKMELELSAGTVNMGETVCASFEADLSAGKLNVDGVVSPNVDIDLSAGNATVKNVECNNMELDLSAGSVIIGQATCSVLDVDISAGSVSVGLIGDKAEYTVTVDRSAGSCNLSNQTGTTAGKRINVDVSAGSVSVTFTAQQTNE